MIVANEASCCISCFEIYKKYNLLHNSKLKMLADVDHVFNKVLTKSAQILPGSIKYCQTLSKCLTWFRTFDKFDKVDSQFHQNVVEMFGNFWKAITLPPSPQPKPGFREVRGLPQRFESPKSVMRTWQWVMRPGQHVRNSWEYRCHTKSGKWQLKPNLIASIASVYKYGKIRQSCQSWRGKEYVEFDLLVCDEDCLWRCQTFANFDKTWQVLPKVNGCWSKCWRNDCQRLRNLLVQFRW